MGHGVDGQDQLNVMKRNILIVVLLFTSVLQLADIDVSVVIDMQLGAFAHADWLFLVSINTSI